MQDVKISWSQGLHKRSFTLNHCRHINCGWCRVDAIDSTVKHSICYCCTCYHRFAGKAGDIRTRATNHSLSCVPPERFCVRIRLD